MSNPARNLTLALCAALALAACNNQQQTTASSSANAPATAATAVKSEPEKLPGREEMSVIAGKANTWLDVLSVKSLINLPGSSIGANSFSSPSFDELSSKVSDYLKAVDKGGELDLERVSGEGTPFAVRGGLGKMFMTETFAGYVPSSADKRQEYLDFLKKVAALPPSLPAMDQAGLAFGQRLVDLSATFDDIQHYYDSNAYKLDDFKQGKALHHQLAEQYRAYLAASQALQDAHDAQYQQQHQKELVQLQHDDQQATVAVYQASDAVDELFNGLATRWNRDGNLDGLDVKQFQASVDKLEQLAAKVKQFEGQNDRLKQENITSDHLASFVQALDDAVISAKVLIKELRQGHDKALLQDLQDKRGSVVDGFNNIVT